MTKLFLPLAAAAASITLAACQPQVENVSSTAPDPQAEAVAKKGPITLPPSITAQKTFRCKDQSLAAVTFFSDNKQVSLKAGDATTPVLLKAPNAGEPYTADGGYVLTGTPAGITLTLPGKDAQPCKA